LFFGLTIVLTTSHFKGSYQHISINIIFQRHLLYNKWKHGPC